MIGQQCTIRFLTAAYVAVAMPLCCCYGATFAGERGTPSNVVSQHHHDEPGHDHGRHPGDHDGNHGHSRAGQEEPTAPGHDHPQGHDSCDCNCEGSATDVTIPPNTAPDAPQLDLAAIQCPYDFISSHGAKLWSLPMLQCADLPPPCNSLVLQHCALVV